MRGESVRLCFVGILFFTLARSQLPSVSLPCSIRGVALVGGDLADSDGGGGFAAEDAAECQYECDRRANCNFWSHVDEWKVRLVLLVLLLLLNTLLKSLVECKVVLLIYTLGSGYMVHGFVLVKLTI